jgi:monovalent cation/proton antiporter MnhG/PhaG subunit
MIEIVVSILVILSAIAIFIAAVGILRFDNLLARTHLVTKVTSYALMLLIIAINLMYFNWIIFLKSLIVFHVLIFLSPISAHLIAKISKLLNDDDDETKYNFPESENLQNNP